MRSIMEEDPLWAARFLHMEEARTMVFGLISVKGSKSTTRHSAVSHFL